MSHATKILEAKIQIGGEIDKSLQRSIDKSTVEFNKLKKEIGTFSKYAIKAFAAVGAAAAAAFGATMVKAGADYSKAMTDIATQTGASGEALKEFGDIARDVWKTGKGENLEEVAAAMSNIHQASKLAGDELKAATDAAITLKDAFGIEVEESTRAASSLMKNFGISANEAYGLIAYGAQNGANRNGDLVDVLNEYSVQFKSLGLGADQFMTSLVKGAEQGAWQIDKVGDAMKEFNIRAKDGSKKSVEAFEALGLNGKAMTESFAQGGEAAEKAFFQTVKALQKVDNEVQRNAVGVALFGTMYEDLEKGLLDMAASMETANIAAGDTLDQVSAAKYGGVSTAISEIGRSFQDAMIPGAEKAGQALKDNMPAIKDAIADLSPLVEKLADWIGDKLPVAIEKASNALSTMVGFITDNKDALIAAGEAAAILYGTYKSIQLGVAIFESVKTAVVAYKAAQIAAASSGKTLTAAQWALNAAMSANPIGAISLAIGALIAAIWLCWENWDKITKWMTDAWKAFEEKFPKTAETLKAHWNQFCDNLKLVWDLVSNSLTASWEYLKNIFLAVVALFKGDWDGFCEHFNAAGRAIIDGFKNGWDILCNWFSTTYERFKPVIDAIKNAFSEAVAWIKEKWNTFYTFFGEVGTKIMEYFKQMWRHLGSWFNGVLNFFQPAITAIKNTFTNLWNGIKQTVVTVFEAIPAVIKTPINAVIRVVNNVIDSINSIGFSIPDWVPGIGGNRFSVNVPKMPMLAAGGFTDGVSIAGEAGTEAVISFDPRYRKENQGYLMTAAEMLGMTAAPRTSNTSTNNISVNFSPVIKTGGENSSVLAQLRACMPELVDMIEEALEARKGHRYA